MKRYMMLALAVALALLLIPAAIAARVRDTLPENTTAAREAPPAADGAGETAESKPAEKDTVAVFMSDEGRVQTLPLREYLISAVAGEMPAAYETEALKAQALASLTLVRYLQARGVRDETLCGAQVSTDAKRHQAYMRVEEMKTRWGERFEEYYEKLQAAVDAVLPYVITYGGEPIMAAFHAVSTGVTETAETVWGKAVPYLVSCESAGDKLSPGFASEAAFSPEELKEKLALPETQDPPAGWLGEASYSEAGTLLQITICGKPFTGFGLREALGLRSAAVKPEFNGETFVFHVTGYGHGVGLSQYGADYYARQGMNYGEILRHYYPGTEIVFDTAEG